MDDFKKPLRLLQRFFFFFLIGQTNLTTTNLCILKGHSVSAGIMCADIGFIWVIVNGCELPFCCLPQHASSPSNSVMILHFPKCLSTTPKQLDTNVAPISKSHRQINVLSREQWQQQESKTFHSRKSKSHIILKMLYGLWLCCIMLYSTDCCQCRKSISVSSTMCEP